MLLGRVTLQGHGCCHADDGACRSPEEETAALDAQADVAPHIQDDFDLEEGTLQALDVEDNPDFQACTLCS